MPKRVILLFLVLHQCVSGIYRHDKFVHVVNQKQAAKFKDKNVPLSEYSPQMNSIPTHGLPKCFNCLKVGIVGAGVSGLTAGVELARAGHRVTIYEGSFRVGGRILTYRKPGTNYVMELGAMRLPLSAHRLLKDYIDNRYHLPYKEYITADDDAMVYINNVHATVRQVNENPDIFGFDVREDERAKVRSTKVVIISLVFEYPLMILLVNIYLRLLINSGNVRSLH